MEKDLKQWLTAMKERFRSWRPTVSEISHDYRDLSGQWRTFFNRFPRLIVGLGWTALFLGGVLAGVGLRTLTEERLAIGHEDYRLMPTDKLYALNELREKALDAGASLLVEPKKTYPVCDAQEKDPSL